MKVPSLQGRRRGKVRAEARGKIKEPELGLQEGEERMASMLLLLSASRRGSSLKPAELLLLPPFLLFMLWRV